MSDVKILRVTPDELTNTIVEEFLQCTETAYCANNEEAHKLLVEFMRRIENDTWMKLFVGMNFERGE